MTLFLLKQTKLHSGEESNFKIECDALTDEDIDCIAYIISTKVSFGFVYGVPKGGIRLEKALYKYCDNSSKITLIVDDVLTTGNSMVEFKNTIHQDSIIGFVVFARNKCPDWITAIFQM